MKRFAKSCVEGLGWEKEFVFANSFPITRHTTEFVSGLYSVKPPELDHGDEKESLGKRRVGILLRAERVSVCQKAIFNPTTEILNRWKLFPGEMVTPPSQLFEREI